LHALVETSEAASPGFELNSTGSRQNTKVQALGSSEDEPSTITVQGQEVAAAGRIWLPDPLTTQSSSDISRRNVIIRK